MASLLLWCTVFLLGCGGRDAQPRSQCLDCGSPLPPHPGLSSQVRGHCTYPCRCPDRTPECPAGVPLVTDGCGCCDVCARQQGDVCDKIQPCDARRQLECVYPADQETAGTCKVKQGQGCQVGGHLYKDGETFKLDCGTQCTCQNGTYGCVSLCPHENVRPSAVCRNPRLVRIREACCREWLCESFHWENVPPHCNRYSTAWSPCSASCGAGLSTRVTNDNAECSMSNETRLCHLRPCLHGQMIAPGNNYNHRTRRHHQCRATVKSPTPVRLSDGVGCTSTELYQPKYCGYCPGRQCCSPSLSTTIRVPFRCVRDPSATTTVATTAPSVTAGPTEEEEADVVTKDVMWIVKCACADHC